MTLPAWVPDVETKPAPMPLLVVQSLVNTWEADTGVDLLADVGAAGVWLRAAGLLEGTDLDDAELEAVRLVRGALRGLLIGHEDAVAGDGSELAALRALAAPCRVRLVLGDEGQIELEPDPARSWLTSLLLIVRDAQRDGTWPRLKACRNPECRWAFYDRSHASRGAWCDMAVCGNRIKNRNLRSRRSAGT